MAKQFDVELFAFTDGPVELAPVLEFCARVVLVEKPRYREPRWSTLLPPEVHEFRSPAMRQAIARGAPRLRLRDAAGGVHAARRVRRRHPGGARRHLRSVHADRAPRAHALRRVGRLPLAPLRNPRAAAVPARRGDVGEGRGDGGRAERGDPQRRGPRALPRRAGSPGRAPALHRQLPPLPQCRGLPLLHRRSLAAVARQVPEDVAHRGLRRRLSHLLARLHRFARARARPAHPPARIS